MIMVTFNRFYTNPFSKHIDKLDKTRLHLMNHQTTGGTPMEVNADQQKRVDSAIKHLEQAIAALKELDMRK
ncbi:MAG TPA: hypothetical protein VK172_07310 [Lentimicrobium sp.]|nr:hypothetical protein [Lentimicrobium sp.]